MPRPRKIDRPVRMEFQIPESLAAKINLELWSELEGRVPNGVLSATAVMLFERWLVERGVE